MYNLNIADLGGKWTLSRVNLDKVAINPKCFIIDQRYPSFIEKIGESQRTDQRALCNNVVLSYFVLALR